jgi:hypothetical protein
VLFDVESCAVVDKTLIAAVMNADVVQVIDPNDPTHWHCPKNEREYRRSPQKDYWRTAQELKMENYKHLKLFTLVHRSVPRKLGMKVMRSLWARRIKYDEHGKFDKLNPRWCIVGTPMDRTLYASLSLVVRSMSVRIIACIYITYHELLIAIQFDIVNAFQATRTDGPDSKLPRLFIEQSPGHEEEGPNGEPASDMVAEVLCGMQGRIDSAKIFGDRLEEIYKAAHLVACLWDPKVFIYHEGPLVGTDAGLREVLEAMETAPDNSPGHPPPGYVCIGQHVDDGISFRSRKTKAMEYISSAVREWYEMTMTGWKKLLGRKATIDLENRRFCFECPAVLEQIKKDYLMNSVVIAPKHVTTPQIMQLEKGEVPPRGHPDHDAYIAMQEETARGCGLMQWVGEDYPQIKFCNSKLQEGASCYSWDHSKLLKFMMMHLIAHPDPAWYGGPECRDLTLASPSRPPHDPDGREYGLMAAVDAGVQSRNITCVVTMLAGGPIDVVVQRQHIAAKETHMAELHAAATGYHRVLPARGLLTELRVHQVLATPYYMDSASTIFVAKDLAAVKKSIWTIRKAMVLHEGVVLNDIDPRKIDESDNVSDPGTKYLPYPAWNRHWTWTLNAGAAA